MAQKVIKVVGTSKESFAKCGERRGGSCKDGRDLKWARVCGLEMELMARASPSTESWAKRLRVTDPSYTPG